MPEKTQARMDAAIAQIEMARRVPDAWLDLDAVMLLTRKSKPSIYRWAREGSFPRPVSRGRWRGGDVLTALAGQSAT